MTPAEWKQYRLEMFLKVCPPLYAETDAARLPPQSQPVLALEFKREKSGILLMGPTRACKTRTAWLLIRKWYLEGQRTLLAFNGGSFGREVARVYGNGEAAEWHRLLQSIDMLFLDDIFKHRLTEAVQDALFSIIEDRMAWKKTTIVTMNNGAGGIRAAVADDMAEPLIERLREYCKVFLFGEEKQK